MIESDPKEMRLVQKYDAADPIKNLQFLIQFLDHSLFRDLIEFLGICHGEIKS